MNWAKHKYEQRNWLAIIQEASREELSELDLSNEGLTEIPEAIGRLTSLKSSTLATIA